MLTLVDSFFNSGFERDAVLTTASGSQTIKVIFDNKYQAAQLQGIDLAGSNPMATCRTADVSSVKTGDTLEIDSVLYKVCEPPENDGTGLTVLQLSLD